MTPAARVQAAIACLDDILAGKPAEQVLTGWARANRYAGSKDRAAVRDHVFDALRCRRSAAASGGALTGRGLMIGVLRGQGTDPAQLFDGSRYGPPALGGEEGLPSPMSRGDRLDLPDWCLPHFDEALGGSAEDVALTLRNRAPVFLRVNRQRTTRENALDLLEKDAITGRAHVLSPTAIEVTAGARKIRTSHAFQNGLVELQDVASQAITDDVADMARGGLVLDYCAGGGGKALALAAHGAKSVTAHDALPGRMADIPKRAARAGVKINVRKSLSPGDLFDLVFVDAPCSGSGAWRRQPEAKWRLTEDRLSELNHTQDLILERAQNHVRPGGCLAYATCSLFLSENMRRVARFLDRNTDWRLDMSRQLTPLDGGDGFFLARLIAPTASV